MIKTQYQLHCISVRAPDSCLIVVGTFLDKVSEEDGQSGKINDLLRKVEELTREYHCIVVTNITVVGLKGRMENVEDYIYNVLLSTKSRISMSWVIRFRLVIMR